MESSARRKFIADSNWFEGAPSEILDRLAESASVKQYTTNSYLWSMGETNTEVFGVVSGRMRMYIASTMGQEFALIDREQGAWLGEACLLDDEGRLIGARAMEPSRVLVIPRQALKDAAEDWPQLYRNLFFHQVLTSRGLYVLYSAVLFYPLKARVAGRLLDLLREHGRTVNAGILLCKSGIQVVACNQVVYIESKCFAHSFRLYFCLRLRNARCFELARKLQSVKCQ